MTLIGMFYLITGLVMFLFGITYFIIRSRTFTRMIVYWVMCLLFYSITLDYLKPDPNYFIVSSLFFHILLLVPFIVARKKISLEYIYSYPLELSEILESSLCFVIPFAFLILSSYVHSETIGFRITSFSFQNIINLFLLLLVAPITEELFYKYFFQIELEKKYGGHIGLFGCSVLQTLNHVSRIFFAPETVEPLSLLFRFIQSPFYVVLTFVFLSYFVILIGISSRFYDTQKIIYSILGHMFFNLIFIFSLH